MPTRGTRRAGYRTERQAWNRRGRRSARLALARGTNTTQDSQPSASPTTRMAAPPPTGPTRATTELPTGQAEAREDARYQPLFALSPLPAWVYDSDTLRFLEVNEAAVRSYGWTREEFLGMTLRDIRPPAEQARLDALRAASPGGEAYASAAVHPTKPGALPPVEISSSPLAFAARPAPTR